MRICFNTCMAKVLQSMDLMKIGTYFRLSTNALIAKTIDRIMKSKNTPPTKIAKPHATESKDNKIRNTIANKPKTMKRIKLFFDLLICPGYDVDFVFSWLSLSSTNDMNLSPIPHRT